MTSKDKLRWNSPPNWPEPPPGWVPPEGWQPLPEWGAAPAGWQFWVPVEADRAEPAGPAPGAAAQPPAGAKEGFFRRRHVEHAVAKQAKELAARQSAYANVLAAWQSERDEVADLLDEAREAKGDPPSVAPGFMGHAGEEVFLVGNGCALVEPRRGPTHWVGGSQGVSFRIAKGVTYRVGQTRGHVVSGPEAPTPIDMGRLVVTNQRAVFQGQKQGREWLWPKLTGFAHDSSTPYTSFQVSNRQKVSGILYDSEHANIVRCRIELAIATYQGNVSGLVDRLEAELAQIDAKRPAVALGLLSVGGPKAGLAPGLNDLFVYP
jgi:hypothetical protein